MTTVSTNLRNTRERAKQLRFEPSGSVVATNVQDAILEVAADSLPNLTTPTIKTANGSIAATDVVVLTNQAGAINLTLPHSVTWAAQNSKYGLPLTIVDISGAASTNNVVISGDGLLIDGLPIITITTDYGGYRLMPKPGGGWIVV